MKRCCYIFKIKLHLLRLRIGLVYCGRLYAWLKGYWRTMGACKHQYLGSQTHMWTNKLTLHCNISFFICQRAHLHLITTLCAINATVLGFIYDGNHGKKKNSSKYPTNHSVTDDRNEITNKEKQILIDIGQIFITVVKCLDVLTEKKSN